jgi:hypothetical protein
MPIDIVALREKLTKMAERLEKSWDFGWDEDRWAELTAVVAELRELEATLAKEES